MGFGQGTMEDLVSPMSGSWRGRPVLVTGHTGFKGAWLALWLARLGARVHGFALDPATSPSLFEAARIAGVLASDTRADLAELDALRSALVRAQPEVVFHLAAQSLVREGYSEPLSTFATNVMGTAHLLEAARAISSIRAIVVVTTDKVYENRESMHAYGEGDPLGGHDPYSASKAAAEIVSASYRSSFFTGHDARAARVATARAGNVIGGGDWAKDRLVPDALRCFGAGEPLRLRFPAAVRPWQHVLEPLSGYVRLAEALLGSEGTQFAKAWNFGPARQDVASVNEVATAVARLWGEGARLEESTDPHPHEAGFLMLDSRRAHESLAWQPRWSLDDALARTVAWQRNWRTGADMQAVTLAQIDDYISTGSA
jgi:CDP-glucose 4,6-dehydratase